MPTCVRLAAHADVSVVANLCRLVVRRLTHIRDLGVLLSQKGHSLSQVTIADLSIRSGTALTTTTIIIALVVTVVVVGIIQFKVEPQQKSNTG